MALIGATSGAVWNTPLPANAPIATHSASYIADLNNLMTATGLGGRGGQWAVDHQSNSTRVYFPPQNTPRVPVRTMFFNSWDQEFNSNPTGDPWERLHYIMLQGVPLIDRPAGISDAIAYSAPDGSLGMQSCEGNGDWPLEIILPDGQQWNLWGVWRGDWKEPNGTYTVTKTGTSTWVGGSDPRQGDRPFEYGFPGAHGGAGRFWANTGTWRAWHGAYIPDHHAFKDSLHDISGNVTAGSSPFYQSTKWGNRATGIPTPYGVILQADITRGTIDHALGFAMADPTAGFWWPAVRDDGYAGSGVVKEGSIFRLKASVPDTVTTGYGASFDALVGMIRRCVKTYGMILVDKTGFGGGISFACDANANVDWNPGTGNNPPYSGDLLRAGMPAFTTANWEVISPAYRPPGFFEGTTQTPSTTSQPRWGILA